MQGHQRCKKHWNDLLERSAATLVNSAEIKELSNNKVYKGNAPNKKLKSQFFQLFFHIYT